jgi:hypothetical protein
MFYKLCKKKYFFKTLIVFEINNECFTLNESHGYDYLNNERRIQNR